jgi:dTDP-4-dehydrorhamnose 3,5-epimerase
MIIHPTRIVGALIVIPDVYPDPRGSFKETFRVSEYAKGGITAAFVQDNVSRSTKGVLRGLHYDVNVTKLVQVICGETYHVIADMRQDSPTYLHWQAFTLSDEGHQQVFVPPGVANGFYVLSDVAFVHYKQGTYYNPATDRCVRWNDPALNVAWPGDVPILSDKDRLAPDYRR